MKHVSAVGTCVLCAAIAIGCERGRSDDAELEAQRTGAGQVELDDDPISVTGCLTAEGDRFMLTRLEENAAPVATTEIYQLDGDDDELRQHVGKMVQVFGGAPPADVTQLAEQTAPAPAGTAGQDDSSAQVSVRETTRFETRELDVISLTATDQSCPSAATRQ
jgi:hypothetical protein